MMGATVVIYTPYSRDIIIIIIHTHQKLVQWSKEMRKEYIVETAKTIGLMTISRVAKV